MSEAKSEAKHSFSESYKAAGVDITAGYEAVSAWARISNARRRKACFPLSAGSAGCSRRMYRV